MLTVEDYGRIRRAHRDGMSIRAIARRFHHSRRKIRQILKEPEPRPYTLSEGRPAPILDPVKPIIDQILRDDEGEPRKQRHTAAQIYRRLCEEEGYPGSYDQVRRYVRGRRKLKRETFIPLRHEPGERLEADFGHIYVDFPDGRRQVPVLLLTWSYSHYCFAYCAPTERVEAILAGMVSGFEFFGCVPREVWWDNPRTVAKSVLKGRSRKLNDVYAALASHYVFDPLFCMPRRGEEKPHVENRVYDLQRRWATPVPKTKGYGEFNDYLANCCRAELARTISRQTETIGARFERDQEAAHDLPERPFDACVKQGGDVGKYQTVLFDTNRYSVPRRYAFQSVTVKGYVDRVDIVLGERLVASHKRRYERGKDYLNPLHYLATLELRPSALDHSEVYGDWELPESFGKLRAFLERRRGERPGLREYITVLQLLSTHPLYRVADAIETCLSKERVSAAAIAEEAERQASRKAVQPLPDEEMPHFSGKAVEVPRPDLRSFDIFLQQGVIDHEQGQHDDAAENKSQTPAATDDERGVREASA